MWTHRALIEALGNADHKTYSESAEHPGRRRLTLTWECRYGGVVKAVSDVHDLFTLDVSCDDVRHKALGYMAQARVTKILIVDNSTSRDRASLPGALEGATIVFDFTTPVEVYVRIDLWLDAEHRLREVEELPGGVYCPGAHRVSVPLRIDPKGPGKCYGPAKSSVQLVVQILDPDTAVRDCGAEGIVLYRHLFSVLE